MIALAAYLFGIASDQRVKGAGDVLPVNIETGRGPEPDDWDDEQFD